MDFVRILLIEDDVAHCDEYKNYCSRLENVNLFIANGCKQGVDLLKKEAPDIVLLDLELHDGDGDGILFLESIKSLDLKKTPYIIVITNNDSEKTYTLARANGADYIFPKRKLDYSPTLVIDFVYRYFQISSSGKYLEKQIKQNDQLLEAKVAQWLEDTGFTRDLIGTYCLVDAALIAIKSGKIKPNLKNDVYPHLAEKYDRTVGNIEKAIDGAIKTTWRTTDMRVLTKHYTAEVDYVRGAPTNAELICFLRDKFRT